MKQIQFEIVQLEVEKLFEQGIYLTNTNDICNHFDFIRKFIESCGWSYDSYVDKMMGWKYNIGN